LKALNEASEAILQLKLKLQITGLNMLEKSILRIVQMDLEFVLNNFLMALELLKDTFVMEFLMGM